MKNNKKGAILFIVLAVIILVVVLSGVILSIISSQSRLTHHQVSRIKAYYAGKGMMNYTLEKLRTGVWAPHTSQNRYACHRGCIDSGVTSSIVGGVSYAIPTDPDIPYKVQVTIRRLNSALGNTVTQLEIKTQYTDNL